MAEHVWTVLCERAVTDRESNIISLLQVTEQISLEGDPAIFEKIVKERDATGGIIPVQLQLVTWWIRSDQGKGESLETRLTIVNPSGRVLLEKEVTVDLVENSSRRVSLQFEHFPLTEVGIHWFEIRKTKPQTSKKQQWLIAARIPLDIKFVT